MQDDASEKLYFELPMSRIYSKKEVDGILIQDARSGKFETSAFQVAGNFNSIAAIRVSSQSFIYF